MNFTVFTGKISKHHMIEEHPLEYQRLTNAKEVPTVRLRTRISWGTIIASGLMGMVTVSILGWLLIVAIF